MDALFGLSRKKSAGESYRDPLHGQLYFYDQKDLDEYVKETSCHKNEIRVIVCNYF